MMITLTILVDTKHRHLTLVITIFITRSTRILLVINIIDNNPLRIRDAVTKPAILMIAQEVPFTSLVILILTNTVLVRRTITNLEMRTVRVKLVVGHHCLLK
jgi:hypothetical protein